jgi:hypothetical protein
VGAFGVWVSVVACFLVLGVFGGFLCVCVDGFVWGVGVFLFSVFVFLWCVCVVLVGFF